MIWTIVRREYTAYFTSPIAYIYLSTYLVVSNWLFFRGFFIIEQATMAQFFNIMPWVFLFFIPAASMGKWAEEKKSGTIELILTLPVTDKAIVIGKFLASLGLITTAIIFTLPMAITVSSLGNMDWGIVIGGYAGLILLGSAYLSIGLFISALCENQIVAFIISVVICFAMLILGEPIVTLSIPAKLAAVFQYIGLAGHFESIGRGVVDSRDIIYYLSVIGFFLWCNLKALEARSWK